MVRASERVSHVCARFQLATNQCTLTLDNTFAAQRAMVQRAATMFFDTHVDQLAAQLCVQVSAHACARQHSQLLRHGASRIARVRSQAAASLYTLLRHSITDTDDACRRFARVKMQITVALSQLVSTAAGVHGGFR
jgi:hypothetical protein